MGFTEQRKCNPNTRFPQGPLCFQNPPQFYVSISYPNMNQRATTHSGLPCPVKMYKEKKRTFKKFRLVKHHHHVVILSQRKRKTGKQEDLTIHKIRHKFQKIVLVTRKKDHTSTLKSKLVTRRLINILIAISKYPDNLLCLFVNPGS